MQNEIDLKLMVAALSAVLFYENEGDVLMVSKAREKGSNDRLATRPARLCEI